MQQPARVAVIDLFYFEQLDEAARWQARRWYVDEVADTDAGWHRPATGGIRKLMEIAGIQIRHLSWELQCENPRAHFTGDYHYQPGTLLNLKAHAPADFELHGIFARLDNLQRAHGYQLSAISTGSPLSMRPEVDEQYIEVSVNGWVLNGSQTPVDALCATDVTNVFKDLMTWMHARLDTAWVERFDDRQVAEALNARGILFDRAGRRYGYEYCERKEDSQH